LPFFSFVGVLQGSRDSSHCQGWVENFEAKIVGKLEYECRVIEGIEFFKVEWES
jgi:hypothetical protein